MLTRDQITQNIEALEKQGASQPEIQEWLDSLRGQAAPTPEETPKNNGPLSSIPGVGGALQGMADFGHSFGNAVLGGIGEDIGKFARLPGEAIGGALYGSDISKGSQGLSKAQADAYATHTKLLQIARGLPEGDPKRAYLEQTANEGIQGLQKYGGPDVSSFQVTPEQALGRTAKAAALVAGGGFNPTSFAQKLLLSTGIGALYGGGAAATENKPLGEVAKSAAIGGATGAAIQTAASGVGAVVKLITQHLPVRLMRAVTGQSSKDILSGQDISKYMLDNRKVGTLDSITRDSIDSVNTIGQKITNNLQGSQGAVSNTQIAQMVAQKINDAGGDISANEVLKIVSDLAPQGKGYISRGSNTVLDANSFRQVLDRTLGDRGFLSSQLPFNKYVLREFANTLRSGVKAQAPMGTRGLFDTLSKEITVRDALLEQASKIGRGSVVRFRDLVGALIGSPLGLPGVIGGVALERGLQSTPFLSRTAVGLNEIGKLAPYMQKLTPAARLFVLEQLGNSSK